MFQYHRLWGPLFYDINWFLYYDFSGCKNLGVCCTHKGGSGTNKSAQQLTRSDRKIVSHPAPPGDRTHSLRIWIPTLTTELGPPSDRITTVKTTRKETKKSLPSVVWFLRTNLWMSMFSQTMRMSTAPISSALKVSSTPKQYFPVSWLISSKYRPAHTNKTKLHVRLCLLVSWRMTIHVPNAKPRPSTNGWCWYTQQQILWQLPGFSPCLQCYNYNKTKPQFTFQCSLRFPQS